MYLCELDTHQVVGEDAVSTLSEFTPAREFNTVIPRAGLKAHNYAVRLFVIARDGLLSIGTKHVDIVITERRVDNPEEQAIFVNTLIQDNEIRLGNGNAEGTLALVGGLANMINQQVRQIVLPLPYFVVLIVPWWMLTYCLITGHCRSPCSANLNLYRLAAN